MDERVRFILRNLLANSWNNIPSFIKKVVCITDTGVVCPHDPRATKAYT